MFVEGGRDGKGMGRCELVGKEKMEQGGVALCLGGALMGFVPVWGLWFNGDEKQFPNKTRSSRVPEKVSTQ